MKLEHTTESGNFINFQFYQYLMSYIVYVIFIYLAIGILVSESKHWDLFCQLVVSGTYVSAFPEVVNCDEISETLHNTHNIEDSGDT